MAVISLVQMLAVFSFIQYAKSCLCNVDMFSTIRRHWNEITSLIYSQSMTLEFQLT